MNYYGQLNAFLSPLVQLQEICDNTLMTADIDTMVYTKAVHDALRSANHLEPIL